MLPHEPLGAAPIAKQADRYGRLGTCKVCGEIVLWWNTDHKARIPLDPAPVFNLRDVAESLRPGANVWVTKGRGRAVCLETDETGDILIYRVHNDGECLRILNNRREEHQHTKPGGTK